jgi:hypothetical protein
MSNRTAEPDHSTTEPAARVTAIVQTAYGDAGVGSDGPHRAPQDHLATLSTNSAQRTAEGAVHEDLVADQALAGVTTQAILDVITSVRTARPLVR